MDDNAKSLEEYFSPLPEHHKRWNLGDCKKVIHVSKVVPGNWKTVQEAFMEFFHAIKFIQKFYLSKQMKMQDMIFMAII